MPLFTTLASLSQTAASNAADGSTDTPSTIDNQLNLLASFIAQLRDGARAGQCRLVKSGSNLVLQPYQGNGIVINGVPQTIPSAGVSLAPTGATPSTNYYIYAFMNAGVMTLEYSTTGHSTDTTTGVEIKTGDATRTLVGFARPIAGPAWQDIDAARFVISWFNRRPIRFFTQNGSSQASSTSVIGPISNAMEFLTWGGAIPASFIAQVTNNTANAITNTGLGLSTTTAFSHAANQFQAYVNNANGAATGGTTFSPGEGYAYVSVNGSVGAGLATWQAGLEASGVIQG